MITNAIWQHPVRKETYQRGFTIIELLICISIISVLAALLFPAFASVRNNSKRDVCISNLRQLGSSIALYANDYDELLPYGPGPIHKQGVLSGLPMYGNGLDELVNQLPDIRVLLRPYKVVPELFHCPLDTAMAANPWQSEPYFTAYGSSYSYDAEEWALRGKSLGSYSNPSDCLMLSDADAFHLHDGNSPKLLGALFVDFHVKTISWDQRIKDLQEYLK